MLKKSLSLLLTLAMVFSLAACTPKEAAVPQGDTYTFTDDSGTEITLPKKPQKVAVLFSSYADIWSLAGGEVAITVGESVERGLAPEDVLLVDDGAGKIINTELLVSYRPDFVICSADIEAQVSAADLLRKAGIPCGVFRVEQFSDYLKMLKICTDLTGNEDAYQRNGTEVAERIDKLLKGVEGKTGKDILFIRSGSSNSSAKAKTDKENFVCVMLKELGTYNIAENAPVLLDGLSIEEILTADPDYIFISTMGKEDAAKAYMNGVLAGEDWGQLTAVREGNYCYLPKDLFQFKPNAHWDEAYQYLIDLLYPTGE